MKVLIAPDSFKGTYSAVEVAAAIAAGVRETGAHAVELPLADGGEGTLTALASTTNAQLHTVEVNNPWGQPVAATFALTPDHVGVVELAQASGIAVEHNGVRDAYTADTYGTGQLILAAVNHGARTILVSAGGSATSDGGSGAIRALEEAGGLHVPLTVLTDVTTPFEQAGEVFGPQKGADPQTVERITARLRQQAHELPRDPTGVKRTGAAGGFSGGMWAQYSAELISGADYVLDFVGFNRALGDADVVVVGEGKLDSQTEQGKIIDAVLARVQRLKPSIPVVAVVGCVGDDLRDYAENFTRIIEATDADLMRRAGHSVAGHST